MTLINIQKIPFSRCGSYIAFSEFQGERQSESGNKAGVWMRCVAGDAIKEVFHLELIQKNYFYNKYCFIIYLYVMNYNSIFQAYWHKNCNN